MLTKYNFSLIFSQKKKKKKKPRKCHQQMNRNVAKGPKQRAKKEVNEVEIWETMIAGNHGP